MHPKILLVLLPLLAASACLGNPPQAKPREFAAEAVIIDQSLSSPSTDRCGEVAARARDLLTKARHISLLAIGTGTQATTGTEPIVLVPWITYDASPVAFEAEDAEAKRREAWLSGIRETCQQRYTPEQKSSEIFSAIARAVGSLAARCRNLEQAGSTCVSRTIWIHSDARDSSPAIAAHLSAKPGSRRKLPKLPELDVEGVLISFCLGEHVADRNDPTDVRRVYEVWVQILGADLPPFDISCPSIAPSRGGR